MNLVTLDFETYYDKDYSLKKLSTEAYIRDPRFEIIGVSIKINDGPALWYTGDQVEPALRQINWAESYVLAHNTAFDGAILAWKLGIRPSYYLDTLSMARPITGATVGGSLAALVKKFMLGEKGDEVIKAQGKHLRDFSPAEIDEYGSYCKNDTELTYLLFQVLKQPTR